MKPDLIATLDACRNASTLPIQVELVWELIEAVHPKVHAYLLLRCPGELLEEILTEVQDALIDGFPRCKAQSERTLWAWVFTVVKRARAKAFATRERRGEVSLELEEVRQVVDSMSAADEGSAVSRADLRQALELLGAFKAPCVGYLLEAYVEDLPYEVMGILHSMKADTMRKNVDRCLDLARKLVRERSLAHA